MAKDYTVPDHVLSAFRDAFAWYRDAGDQPDVAFMKALSVVGERCWQLKHLARHVRHGRLAYRLTNKSPGLSKRFFWPKTPPHPRSPSMTTIRKRRDETDVPGLGRRLDAALSPKAKRENGVGLA